MTDCKTWERREATTPGTTRADAATTGEPATDTNPEDGYTTLDRSAVGRTLLAVLDADPEDRAEQIDRLCELISDVVVRRWVRLVASRLGQVGQLAQAGSRRTDSLDQHAAVNVESP